jgi:putative Holliday junction resolvase
MRYLGIDYGEKRIGLALGDDTTRVASPFRVIGSIHELAGIIREEGVGALVIGMPHRLAEKGEKGWMQKKVEMFMDNIGKLIEIKMITVDERLSTKGAQALEGTKKTKAPKDAISAMLILQNYFDSLEAK